MPIGASVALNDRYMPWAWKWRKHVWLGEKWSIVGEKKLNHLLTWPCRNVTIFSPICIKSPDAFWIKKSDKSFYPRFLPFFRYPFLSPFPIPFLSPLPILFLAMSCPSWQRHRAGYRWSPVWTLPVAPLWCDLGLWSQTVVVIKLRRTSALSPCRIHFLFPFPIPFLSPFQIPFLSPRHF